MKHFIFYTLLILSSFFIFSGLLYKSINTVNQKIRVSNTDEKIKKDTSLNKLPEGYPYITNFTLAKQKRIKSICSDSIGVMVFADNSGVTFFDGATEKYLKIPDLPVEIKKDKKYNRFYVACKKGFGIISKNNTGNYIYHSLTKKSRELQSYNNIIVTNNEVIFSGYDIIYKYDLKTKQLEKIFNNKNKSITGIFVFNNKLYINFLNEGLQTLTNNKLTSIITDSLFSFSKIIFNVPYEKNLIIGLSNSRLYIFDGTNYSSFENNSSEYLEESIINGGGNFNKNQLVVTSINGGAVILDKKTGTTLNTLNYITGLPDDEIYAFAADQTGGLWLAHEYGISRVAFDIPVKNFSRFPGLQGNINAVKFYDSTLYVATGEGLFKLSELKSYEEVEIAENKRVKYLKKINVSQNNSHSENISDNNSETQIKEGDKESDYNSSFFKRWKKRREKKRTETKNISDDSEKNTVSDKIKNKNKYFYKKGYKTITEYKKIYELHSVKYFYKKIDGINSKCKTITEYNNGILIGANSGLYYIKNNKLTVVIPEVYIYTLSCNNDINTFFVSTSKGLYKIKFSHNQFHPKTVSSKSISKIKIKSLLTVNDSTVWATGNNKIYLFRIPETDILSTEQFNINADDDEKIIITKEKNKFFFLTKSGAYYYDNKYNNILENKKLTNILNDNNQIYMLSDSSFTINSGSHILYKGNIRDSLNQLKYAWIFDNVKNITIDDKNDIWLISGNNEIYKIGNKITSERTRFKLYITSIKDFSGNSFPVTYYLKLNSNYKNINIFLSAPGYLKKDFASYFYGIDISNNNEYSETGKQFLTIPELTPGKHILSMYALNSLNEKSQTIKIIIEIKPPIWKRTWFIISVFTTFLILVSLIISAFYRKKQRKIKEYNEILELKVKERTAEIEKQSKLIQNQNIEIYEQYQKIDYQNKEITGSIRYAGKIQKAALSDIGIYSKYLAELFILFKPRDIVSGDFYWISESKNKLFIAAVDCTGHGVPGGFLSMLGISFLNEIVKESGKTEKEIKAADVLTLLRKKIITALSAHGEEERKDGMDMSLAVIDKKNMQLNFAGANNPAYIIRNEKLAKLEADRMPVGSNKKLNHIPFKNKYVSLKPNDCLYLFSDGYADQFGGIKQKKFNTRRFREMLIHIHHLPMSEQKEVSEKILHKWMGKTEQIDDILLIGIKL
ncbi:MAG: SpoIIE family protein phosphatase [Chlorobi bacterium]|nr:SpoIIE family protein phosphatase [Chlorobiota bacterium]